MRRNNATTVLYIPILKTHTNATVSFQENFTIEAFWVKSLRTLDLPTWISPLELSQTILILFMWMLKPKIRIPWWPQQAPHLALSNLWSPDAKQTYFCLQITFQDIPVRVTSKLWINIWTSTSEEVFATSETTSASRSNRMKIKNTKVNEVKSCWMEC